MHCISKICNTNRNYAHKAFIETEFSSGKTAKNIWLVCQGYYYEDEPAKIDGTDGRADDVATRKALVANSKESYLIGKPASDILTCDKHLLSGVTLRTIFTKSTNDFAVISESNKHYKIKIIEANLYVRKNDNRGSCFDGNLENSTKDTCRISLFRSIATNFFSYNWNKKLEP